MNYHTNRQNFSKIVSESFDFDKDEDEYDFEEDEYGCENEEVVFDQEPDDTFIDIESSFDDDPEDEPIDIMGILQRGDPSPENTATPHTANDEVVLGDLSRLADSANKLNDLALNGELDKWMEAKIIKASDYIDDVLKRMEIKAKLDGCSRDN